MQDQQSSNPEEQPELFMLRLNPIYDRVEVVHNVAWARSREELQALIDRERVPVYQEVGPNMTAGVDRWTFHKCFRKGGPLEIYNAPTEHSIVPFPTLQQALRKEEEAYTRWLSQIPEVNTLEVNHESDQNQPDVGEAANP